MAVWKRLWLVFTTIWVVVAALQVFTILAFGEDIDREKVFRPIFFGVAVPAAVFAIGWLWERWRRKKIGL